MKSANQLGQLRIASPCPTTWEQMQGNERVRFCELCSLHVYNIAELTAKEAKSLIANTEGRICAQIYRRSDGTVITKDCPVGLRAIRRRVGRIAGAAFATIISLCGGVFGQKVKDDKACQQQVKITRTMSESLAENGAVAGIILDPNGAVIPKATIAIVDVNLKASCDVISNDEGQFRLSNVTPGIYHLVVKSPGFKDLVFKDLKVSAKETVNVEAILLPGQVGEVIGVVADTSTIDTTSSSITTIITERVIRSLPIP